MKNRVLRTGATYVTNSDDKKEEIIYEVGNQRLALMDLNLETFGMTPRENETSIEYINRVIS